MEAIYMPKMLQYCLQMYAYKANVSKLWPLQWLLFKDGNYGVDRMKKVGRPRKAKRKENISVNLDKSLIAEIEDELSWGMSRSKWIASAITKALNADEPLLLFKDATADDLLTRLYQFGVLDWDIFRLMKEKVQAAPEKYTIENQFK
jgi:hypothetical protein